jgi:hypothetical protein
MRAIFLTIICVLFIIPCFSQTVKRNLYAEALSACVNKEAVDYGTISSRRNLINRIVEYDLNLTSDLPKQFGSIKVEYSSAGELGDRYKKNRSEISLLSLRPMQSDGTNLEIGILHYWFSSPKKRHYSYALEGGCRVKFTYDQEQRQFILAKTELWGI